MFKRSMLDLTSLEAIKSLLRKYHLRPNTDMGQHFLIARQPLAQMIAAGDVSKNDTILEIGPGLGVLTVELARRAGRVIAVEKDRRVANALRDILKHERIGNVEVVEGDILRMTRSVIPASAQGGSASGGKAGIQTEKQKEFFSGSPIKVGDDRGDSYKLISNLPYQITSAVLRKFLEHELRPALLVFMVQKEVAQRVTARPGEMSLLSVSVQFYADASVTAFVSKKDFYPMPEIDSAILKIVPKKILPLHSLDEVKIFFWLVRVGFSARRKMLKNNLAGGLLMAQEDVKKLLSLANISHNIRAQELSIDDWTRLLKICQVHIDKRKDF